VWERPPPHLPKSAGTPCSARCSTRIHPILFFEFAQFISSLFPCYLPVPYSGPTQCQPAPRSPLLRVFDHPPATGTSSARTEIVLPLSSGRPSTAPSAAPKFKPRPHAALGLWVARFTDFKGGVNAVGLIRRHVTQIQLSIVARTVCGHIDQD
jgi:hypothetical protein